MELLHAIFAFNLVTSRHTRRCLCHSPARRHDHRRPSAAAPEFAGMSGAALALGMVSAVATLFV